MGIGRPFIRFAAAFVLMLTLGTVVLSLLPSAALGAPPGPRPGVTPLVKPTAAPLVQPTAAPTGTPTAIPRPQPRPTVGPNPPVSPAAAWACCAAPASPAIRPARGPGRRTRRAGRPPRVRGLQAGHVQADLRRIHQPVDGSDRRLLWEWGRQPKIRRGDGRLVLNGDGQGKDNLWTVNEDGSAARESSLHPEDAHPSWSPNGQRLLFDSEFYTWAGNRAWTIWVQNSVDKGSEPVSVSVAGRVVPGRAPLWLDNDWIVYTGCNFWEGGGSCGLYTAPSWGGDRARQLTTGADDVAGDVLGERIAYSSRLDGNWEVYTVNFDGGGKRNLTNNPANDGLPAFSPDGRSIAFVSDRGGAWAMWVMNADGSGQRKLFDLPGRMGDDWIMERISWGP